MRNDPGFELDVVISTIHDILEAIEQFLLTGPACLLTHSGAQSITHNTVTPLTFDTELVDTESIHSTGVNPTRMTCVTAGRYLCTASVQIQSNATGERQLRILKNGTADAIISVTPVSGNVTRGTISVLLNLAASDYVEIAIFQSSGVTLTVDVAANNSPRVGMVRVG